METLSELVHVVITLDAIAIAVAFVTGMVVAPFVIMIRGAMRWKQRLKWATVSLLTSWFGLWLFWHSQVSADASPSNRAPASAAHRIDL